MTTQRSQRWLTGLILLTYATLAIAFGVVAPPFESPDEIGHFFTIKYIADRSREGRIVLPDPDPEPAQEYLYGQEGTQPPLYYLLGALILRASGASTANARGYLHVNPHTTCGSPHLAGNKAFLAHDPVQEAFPWHEPLLALHVLRLASAGLGLLTVIGVLTIGRLVFPRQPALWLLAAMCTALNPQFLFVSGGINNDNLLVPLCTWAVLLILQAVRRGLTPARSLGAGVLIGLASLTKLGGVLLLPLAGVTVLLVAWRDAKGQEVRWTRFLQAVIRHGLLIAAPVLLIAGWWYLHNALAHGDPTLTEHHLDIVSRRDPTPIRFILGEVPSLFYSYWGRFTCDISPGAWYYILWGLLTAGGLAGIAAGWRRYSLEQRVLLALLGLWALLVFSGWFRWNLVASGVQGRLLFPATASASIMVAAGLGAASRIGPGIRAQHALRPRTPNRLLIASYIAWTGLALWVLFGFLQPAFAPPTRYAAPATAPIPDKPIGIFINPARPEDRIVLHGYQIWPESSVEPGERLEITLFLSTPAFISETYSMGIWLLSAVPGDTSRLTGMDTWPGNGNYPTNAWRAGEVIQDRYVLQIPEQVEETKAWWVQLNVYDIDDGEWFPATREEEALGNRLLLEQIRVGASDPLPVPMQSRLSPAPVFGEAIALRGTDLTEPNDESASLNVILWWEALAPLDRAYTVFVHLVDANGQMIASGDGPPCHGGFPTTLWQAGDTIKDDHAVEIPSNLPAGTYRVHVGWYDPVTGIRLPLASGDSFTLDEPVAIDP